MHDGSGSFLLLWYVFSFVFVFIFMDYSDGIDMDSCSAFHEVDIICLGDDMVDGDDLNDAWNDGQQCHRSQNHRHSFCCSSCHHFVFHCSSIFSLSVRSTYSSVCGCDLCSVFTARCSFASKCTVRHFMIMSSFYFEFPTIQIFKRCRLKKRQVLKKLFTPSRFV